MDLTRDSDEENARVRKQSRTTASKLGSEANDGYEKASLFFGPPYYDKGDVSS